MLGEFNGYQLHRPILNTILKSFLPYIVKNDQWTRCITKLSKVKNVYIVTENKIKKQNDTVRKCPICQKIIYQDNLFILLLHIEIQHQQPFPKNNSLYETEDPLIAKKYQFTYDGMEIHLIKTSSFFEQNKKQPKKSQKLTNSQNLMASSTKDYLIQERRSKFLSSDIKSRNNHVLEKIFSKFSKRLQTISSERKYYHSYNVYQTIRPESQQENSDQQKQDIVQRELQRLRIDDFNDVSYWDKILFLEWNSLLRKEKKQLKILYENQQIVQVLKKFFIICKKLQIPKINLNMHLFTLWSVGRIKDFDIMNLLTFYDIHTEQVQVQKMDKQ